MTDETSTALRVALDVLDVAQGEATHQKQSCLDEIAVNLAARVDSIAHGAALAQPDVTKSLGKEGVQGLRADLATVAESLATDLRGASEKISWPEERGILSRSRSVHSALFEYMHGAKVDRIAAVLKRAGYDVHDDNAQRSQGLVYPQSLYDEQRFGALTEALTRLVAAKETVARARKADDQATVDDIWGEGPDAAPLSGGSSRIW